MEWFESLPVDSPLRLEILKLANEIRKNALEKRKRERQSDMKGLHSVSVRDAVQTVIMLYFFYSERGL